MVATNTPVRKTMCKTCPFQVGSPYAYLAADLTICALDRASRICHSTGSNNAIHKKTGIPPMICRGTRDVQLRVFTAFGFLDEPTDEAWEKKRQE